MRTKVDGLAHNVPVHWDGLFADLEAQASALDQAERAAEIETRTRAEVGRLGLVDRLRAGLGASVRLRLDGEVTVAGALRRVGPDWLLVEETGAREALVVTARLLSVRGVGRYAAVPDSAGVVESRLGLRHALRGIARDRSAVRIHLAGTGTPGAPLVVDATIDRVGKDFIEVATHSAGETRRRAEVREAELVPLAAITVVRRAG